MKSYRSVIIFCVGLGICLLVGCAQQPLPTMVFLPSSTVQATQNQIEESPQYIETEVEVTDAPSPMPDTETPERPLQTAVQVFLPTATSNPVSTFVSSSSTVSTTNSNATNSKIPAPIIYIVGPGPLSRVPSPFKLQAFFRPGDDGKLYVDLTGEDNLKIIQLSLNYSAWKGQTPDIYRDISFSIDSASEYAIFNSQHQGSI